MPTGAFLLPVWFDLIATFAFALTGALAGVKRGYDIVGVFFLALACIPLVNPSWRAWTLVGLVALMNFPGSMSNTAWQSFISRIIPADRRAVAFADRNKFMNLFGTIIVFAAGKALDGMKFPVGYQLVFVLAFLMALVELRIFNYIDEDAAPARASQTPASGQKQAEPVAAAPGTSRPSGPSPR
jgi:MFS family permease